jgi:hypothetical protein
VFAAKALNGAGNASGFSNELEICVPKTPKSPAIITVTVIQ